VNDITPRLIVDVQIVGQASPRWQGANSEAQRIENNQRLSEARARAVMLVVKRDLNKALASMRLKFQYNLSYADDSATPDNTVVIGTSGRGQSDAILAARRDRRNNDPQYRRVDVRIRIAQELQEFLPRRAVIAYDDPTDTEFWYVSVAAGITIAAVASVSLILVQLRNQRGQIATGQAVVGGGGFGATLVPGFDVGLKAGASFGPETSFYTSNPVGFKAFDGVGVEYASMSAGLYFGYEVSRLTFYRLGPGAANISVGGPNLGAQLGGSLSFGNGVLWLNEVPPNYVISSYTQTDYDRYESSWLSEHRASLFFPTGSSELLVDDRANLGDALDKTVQDILGG
jgi:hypothetical protein